MGAEFAEADVLLREDAQPFAGAGGDAGILRLETSGDSPVTVAEFTSEDREWVPFHSHPWDELVYVLEGEMEFVAGDVSRAGGAGTLQVLPRGAPHTLRVPQGAARYLMITIGAPSAAFLREVGEAYAEGPTLDKLLLIAARHGVRLADPPS